MILFVPPERLEEAKLRMSQLSHVTQAKSQPRKGSDGKVEQASAETVKASAARGKR